MAVGWQIAAVDGRLKAVDKQCENGQKCVPQRRSADILSMLPRKSAYGPILQQYRCIPSFQRRPRCVFPVYVYAYFCKCAPTTVECMHAYTYVCTYIHMYVHTVH